MSNEFGLEMSKESIVETIVEDFFLLHFAVLNFLPISLLASHKLNMFQFMFWTTLSRTCLGTMACLSSVHTVWCSVLCAESCLTNWHELFRDIVWTWKWNRWCNSTYTWKLMFNFDLFHQKFSFSFFCCFSKGPSTLVRHWLSWAKMLDKFEFALWRPLSACVKLFKIISDSSGVQLSLRVSYLHVSTERHWIC